MSEKHNQGSEKDSRFTLKILLKKKETNHVGMFMIEILALLNILAQVIFS